MAFMRLTYCEIMDLDFTGVRATVETDQGKVVARFLNYDPGDGEIHDNQTELFTIPSIEIGMMMLQENKEYTQVELSADDHEANVSITIAAHSDLEQIRINTSKGFIESQLNKGDEYPGISISVDGLPVVLVECCESDKRLVIRNYADDQEEPVTINVRSAEISIPKSWSGNVSTD